MIKIDALAYIESFQQTLSKASIQEVLQLLNKSFPNTIVCSTSFSIEDQLITNEIIESGIKAELFTLDTGRLFPETYTVWSRTNEYYNIQIKPYYPDATELENFVTEKGPNSFYESVENRKACCGIRKVAPLKRALKDKSVWITGLRAEHSAQRQNLNILEWDDANHIIKYNPLLYWTTEAVQAYIHEKNIPYNTLHDKGFVSIGCAPCTRAIKAGEDFRAGRWWWEESNKKECGLHA